VAISKATAPDEQVYASTLLQIEDEDVGPAPVILLVGYAIQIPASRTRVMEELIRL
jgi:diphthamide biosynthesis methyltransferase